MDFFNWVAAQPGYAVLSGLLSGSIGVVVGHRLSLDRDRRKEFNELARELRGHIGRHLSFIDVNHQPIPRQDIELYIELLRPRKRTPLALAWADYQEEIGQISHDAVGPRKYLCPVKVKELLERLSSLILLR